MLVQTQRTRVFIMNKAGEILIMIRNLKDKIGYDHHIVLLPGGEVDPGEESMAALQREVKEELGCSLATVKLFYTHQTNKKASKTENLYWPGATTVQNKLEFYVEQKNHLYPERDIVLKEPEKFSGFNWVKLNDLEKFAKEKDCELGDGIKEAAKVLASF